MLFSGSQEGQQNQKSPGEKAADSREDDVSFLYTTSTRVRQMLPDWVTGLKISQQGDFKYHFQVVTKSNCITDYARSHQISLSVQVKLTPCSARRSCVSESKNRMSKEKR